MEDALKDYLRSLPEFSNAYYMAKDYVGFMLNPYIDSLTLSEKTNCDICFPIGNTFYVLGLDTKTFTIWVFYDSFLADA